MALDTRALETPTERRHATKRSVAGAVATVLALLGVAAVVGSLTLGLHGAPARAVGVALELGQAAQGCNTRPGDPGTEQHDNAVIFNGAAGNAIIGIDFEPTQCAVSAGQPFGGIVTDGKGTQMLIKAGRHKTAAVAAAFKQGMDELQALESGGTLDLLPEELNFAVMGMITFKFQSGAVKRCANFRVAQGSDAFRNNWCAHAQARVERVRRTALWRSRALRMRPQRTSVRRDSRHPALDRCSAHVPRCPARWVGSPSCMGITTSDTLGCNCGVELGPGDDVYKFVVAEVTG